MKEPTRSKHQRKRSVETASHLLLEPSLKIFQHKLCVPTGGHSSLCERQKTVISRRDLLGEDIFTEYGQVLAGGDDSSSRGKRDLVEMS